MLDVYYLVRAYGIGWGIWYVGGAYVIWVEHKSCGWGLRYVGGVCVEGAVYDMQVGHMVCGQSLRIVRPMWWSYGTQVEPVMWMVFMACRQSLLYVGGACVIWVEAIVCRWGKGMQVGPMLCGWGLL